MSGNMKYTGTLNVGTSVLASKAEIKLQQGGTASLEFEQGDINRGKLGLKGLSLHDKLSASMWYKPNEQKGELELVTDVGEGVKLIATPTLPLSGAAGVRTVPIKVEACRTISGINAKLTAHPLESQPRATLELSKDIDNNLVSSGKLTVNSDRQDGELVLKSKKMDYQGIRHGLELSLKSSVAAPQDAKGRLTYTADLNDDLSIKAILSPSSGDSKLGALGQLSAVYKMGEVEASCNVNVDGLSLDQMSRPNLQLKSTFDL